MRKFASRLMIFVGLSWGITCLAQTGFQPPFTQCPPVGADTSCAILIVVTDSGISVYTDPSQGPYDQIEDTLIGVQNNSAHTTLNSLPLSSPNPIFGFDGDGICGIDSTTNMPFNPAPPGCPFGPTGYEGPGVSFASINSATTSGALNFAGGLAPGASTYFSLELAIQTLCSPIAGVPLFKQFSSPWGPETYDGYPAGDTTDTIKKWGCYLTSCSMIINYQASAQGSAFSTDPGTLNSWLEAQPDGYKGLGAVNPYACARYARQNGVPLYYQPTSNPNDFVLDNYLCTNNPVILRVQGANGQHWVVATGQTTVNGTNTFLINDPGYNNSDLSAYGFQYGGIRPFSSTTSVPSALVITAHSPIELLVTDPTGLQTGYSNSSSLNQIPASSYQVESVGDDADASGGATTPEVKTLEIQTPVDGQYTVQAVGTGTGSFSIDFLGYDINGAPSIQTLTGSASQGVTTTYSVAYSSSPGSQIGVVPAITLAVSPTSASVSGNTTAQFAATVAYDTTNAGVTWSLSGSGCSGATCGAVSPTATASGSNTTYTGPSAVPNPPTVTLTATSVADSTKSSAIAITVTANYALSASAATPSTLNAGETANATITLTPQAGTSGGIVALTCAVQPATTNVSCSLAPASVSLGSGPSTTTLTIAATTRATSRLFTGPSDPLTPTVIGMLVLLIVIALGVSPPKRVRLTPAVGLALLLVSCGGGSSNMTPQPTGTTYTISVSGAPTQGGPAASTTVTVK
jgi:hypothetical protein